MSDTKLLRKTRDAFRMVSRWRERRRACKRFRLLGVLCLTTLLVACKPASNSVDTAIQIHQKQLEQCRVELAKDQQIPIIGGGHLDASYFAFNVPTVRYEDGQCGTDGFVAEFYWTGEKIVPNSPKFTNVSPGQSIPKEWVLFHNVGVRFGNLKKTRFCKDKQGIVPECPVNSIPKPIQNLPPEKEAFPKNYKGLSISLSDHSFKSMSNIDFRMLDWPREDGYPRIISCFAIAGAEFGKTPLSKDDYENLDFGAHSFPCQLEYWDFPIKGGGARVHTSTDALKKVTPALKALQIYINQSITQEE